MYLGSLKRREQRAFNGSKIIVKLPRTAKCQHKTWRSIKISTHYFFEMCARWRQKTHDGCPHLQPLHTGRGRHITMLWCAERPQICCSVDDWHFQEVSRTEKSTTPMETVRETVGNHSKQARDGVREQGCSYLCNPFPDVSLRILATKGTSYGERCLHLSHISKK